MNMDYENFNSFEKLNNDSNIRDISINKLKEYLNNQGLLDTYKDIQIKYLDNGKMFILRAGVIKSLFYYENGKIMGISNIKGIGELSKLKGYAGLLGISNINYKQEDLEITIFIPGNDGDTIKINRFSEEYFDKIRDIAFINGRDLVLHILEGSSKKTVMKMEDKMLDMMIAEKSIRLIDLAIFLSKGNLTQDQFKKYHKTVMNLLLDQIGDERFSLLPNNKQYQLSTKEGSFQISTGKVTKEELNYLLSAKLLSPEIHQLAIEKIDELEKLEAEKNTELKKDLDQLENEIRDN